jgi:hypothetical protein
VHRTRGRSPPHRHKRDVRVSASRTSIPQDHRLKLTSMSIWTRTITQPAGWGAPVPSQGETGSGSCWCHRGHTRAAELGGPCRCRADVPITHLVVQRLLGRSDLLSRLVELDGDAPDWDWTQRALAHTDEVRRPEPGGRSLKLSAVLGSDRRSLSEPRRPQHGSPGHPRAGHRRRRWAARPAAGPGHPLRHRRHRRSHPQGLSARLGLLRRLDRQPWPGRPAGRPGQRRSAST